MGERGPIADASLEGKNAKIFQEMISAFSGAEKEGRGKIDAHLRISLPILRRDFRNLGRGWDPKGFSGVQALRGPEPGKDPVPFPPGKESPAQRDHLLRPARAVQHPSLFLRGHLPQGLESRREWKDSSWKSKKGLLPPSSPFLQNRGWNWEYGPIGRARFFPFRGKNLFPRLLLGRATGRGWKARLG